MTNEEDVEKKKGSVIFSLVSYVSINCIRFTGMISAQSTPTNNEIQSIYFAEEGQGDCNISTHSRPKVAVSPLKFPLFHAKVYAPFFIRIHYVFCCSICR